MDKTTSIMSIPYTYSHQIRSRAAEITKNLSNFAFNTPLYDEGVIALGEFAILSLIYSESPEGRLGIFITNNLSIFAFCNESYSVWRGNTWVDPVHIGALRAAISQEKSAFEAGMNLDEIVDYLALKSASALYDIALIRSDADSLEDYDCLLHEMAMAEESNC